MKKKSMSTSKIRKGKSKESSPKKKSSGTGSTKPSGSLKGNEGRNIMWGDLRCKSRRSRFKAYIRGIKSAKPFLTRGGLIWYRRLSLVARRHIRTRIQEVDPDGYAQLKKWWMNAEMRRSPKKIKKEKAFISKKDIKDDMVAVRDNQNEMEGVTAIRFMHLGGLKKIIAISIAAGYTREETAAALKIEVTDLNSMVSNDDIKEAVRALPNAVIAAADQKVMRDLLGDNVTPTTAIADTISHRRKKLIIDAHAESRVGTKESIALQEKREEETAKRFGVDRKKGEIIDVDVEGENIKGEKHASSITK